MLPIPHHLNSIFIPEMKKSSANIVLGKIVCECSKEDFMIFTNEEMNIVKAKCFHCDKEYELFDATKHGWDGFVCNSDWIISSSLMKAVYCKKCKDNVYQIEIAINNEGKEDFIEGSNLLKENGEKLSEDDWVNAFGWISITLLCSHCKKIYKSWLDYETR